MRLGFTLRLTQTCKVCQETLDDEKRNTTTLDVALFGALALAVCPSCGQKPENHRDRNYRARARRFIARRQQP